MLETFTIDTFAGRLGEAFLLRPDDSVSFDVRLEGVTPLSRPAGDKGRQPFSLVFVGPRDPLLPQRIYRIEHPELGAFQLFIVPIARDGTATRYEAVFT